MPSRTDAENRKLLEQAVPTFERLKNDRIRCEGDVERAQQAVADADAATLQQLGTTDKAEILKMMAEAREKNSEATDQFVAAVRNVENGLRQLGGN